MQTYINRVNRNEKLLEFLNREIPDDFNEWKCIIIFYSSLHCISAYIKMLGKPIPNSHDERNKNLNPQNQDALYPIDSLAYQNYIDLYLLSKACRYNGFKNQDSYEKWLKSEYNFAVQKHEFVKNYFRKEAIPL